MAWQDSSSASDGIDIRGRHFVSDTGAITDMAFSAVSVSQTAVENLLVGRLSAEGALNGVFSYEILSDSSGAFRVEGDRLIVDDTFRLASVAADSVTIELRVTDTEGNSRDETFVVPIVRPESGTLYVAEDQFLAVSDPDGLSPAQVPDLLTLAGGRVLLTWNGVADFQDFNIVGRLFEADGTPVAPPFTLNTYVDGNELQHDLAALPGGGFVATWSSSDGDGANNLGVRAQMFDVNGNKVGSELIVNTVTQGSQQQPSVTGLAGGGFFIAWADFSGSAPSSTRGEIKGQFFTVAGAKSGGELLINTTTSLPQTAPVVTELASGKILVAWTDNSATGGDTSVSAIRATLLNADGSVSTPEFLVNTTTLQHQHVASATALAGGGFVIVWRDTSENPVPDTNQFRPADIRGQLYDANGQRVGAEFLVNQDTYGAQAEPLVAAGPDGGFVVTWSTWSQFGGDEESLSVMARSYAADGSPAGNEFLVNQIGQSQQSIPAATYLASGDLVFAWWDLQTRLENGEVARQISVRTLGELGEVANGSDQGEALVGGAGRDVLNGGGGDDIVSGGAGMDALSGGTGNDMLEGGLAADSMAGGPGDDTYIVDSAGDSVTELSGEGVDEIRTGLAAFSMQSLTNFENLTATTDIAHDFRGNGGSNRLTGAAGNDFLRLQDGGNDTALGGGGNDTIYYGAAFTASDSNDGGAGSRDSLILQGNYALTLAAQNLQNIEFLSLQSGSVTKFGDTGTGSYDYALTTIDSNVAPGVQLTVNGQSLLAGEDLNFDGSAETAGTFLIYAGHGVDTLKGGAGNDIFFFEGDRFGASDTLNGGAGRDSLVIAGTNGLNHIAFGENAMTGIESLSVNNRFATDPSAVPYYELIFSNGNVAAGANLIVNANSLGQTQTASFDGSAELDGSFSMFGGAGNDHLTGGAMGDTLYGGNGSDTLTGGAGADAFQYRSVSESVSPNSDQILDFHNGADRIDLHFIDANEAAAGDQAFTFIGSTAFTGAAGELRATFDAAHNSWDVVGDTNGDGAADFRIVVFTGGAADPIVGADFVL
jgi:Ca2+-binding RTX toxin-like protein